MKLKCKKVVQEWQKTLYSINWNLLVEIFKNNTFSVLQAFKTAYNSYALKTYKSHEVFFETFISDFGFGTEKEIKEMNVEKVSKIIKKGEEL
jgi:hypothetical protein